MRAPERPDQPRLAAPRKVGESWQRVFGVMGVIFAFPFLLTIPGWFALRAYRRWQRGERDTPVVLIGWGILFAAVFVVALIVGIILAVVQS